MPDQDQTQKLVWLTTDDVVREYGFDPYPYLTDREPRIRGKLQPVVVPNVGVVTQRLWLMGAVVGHPAGR